MTGICQAGLMLLKISDLTQAKPGTGFLMPSDSKSLIWLWKPELSPRELAVRYTDSKRYFVSEASVYRILKAAGMITSPAYLVIRAADEFKDKPSRVNEQWQTDFTYFKIKGWCWYYLPTILDDYSNYVISWKLCSTMKSQRCH
jgi:transposase InsO family protein